MSEFERPSFGQDVPVGTLYDARLDRFLEASILPPNPPPEAVSIISTSLRGSTYGYGMGLGHGCRFDALLIDENLAASVLSGLIEPEGAASYLNHGISGSGIPGAIFHHTRIAHEERMNLSSDYCKSLARRLPRDHGASHVVISARWGLQSIMTLEHVINNHLNLDPHKESFHQDLNEIQESIGKLDSKTSDNDLNSRLKLKYELTLYTDTIRKSGIRHETVSTMLQSIQLNLEHIRTHNDGKGYPVSYTLIPTSLLYDPAPYGTIVPNPFGLVMAAEKVHSFMRLFDEFNNNQQELDEYLQFLQSKKPYISRNHIEEVGTAISNLSSAREHVRSEFRKVLVGVREKALHHRCLQELYTSISTSKYSPEQFSVLAGQTSDKIEFINESISLGATYIGYNDLSLGGITLPHDGPPPYLFYFSNAMLKNSASWHDEHTNLKNFLKKPDRSNQVYIVDCEALPEYRHLQDPSFGPYPGLPETDAQGFKAPRTSSDLRPIADEPVTQKYLNCCIAICDPVLLDVSGSQRHTQRYPVKIPCPGTCCDNRLRQEWLCGSCYVPIEFGPSDDYIYCHCGGSIYSAWKFRCKNERHVGGYDQYSSKDLHWLLKQLAQPDYRNILVMGETGVGKSTLINAFLNYFTFESFDEAKAASKARLQYVIPSSFSINCRDPSDPYGPHRKQNISIGSCNNAHERDGTGGDSATQKASVYRMTYKTTTYQLIDTPGIGDTRGPDQDEKNMRDVLESLSDFKDLHCILVLLKTDQARLTTTFKFCLQELLSYLHRSAADNIVFGFTHTRGSDYAPGDSFRPLEHLLKKHTNAELSLSRQTAYSFDAESFLHLAAYHKGFNGGVERNCRESWDYSRAETIRLLKHVDNLKSHDTSQTLSMNEARQAIRQFMIPMVTISQEIKKNMDSLDDQLKALEDRRLTGDKLRRKLHIERIKLDPQKLEKPRTVCASKDCCDHERNPNGEVITIYKQVCHEDCSLENVMSDCLGARELTKCRAFGNGRDDSCNKCGHHWREHMHHYYDLKEVKVKVKDKEIERQLGENVSDVTVRKEGIERFRRTQQEYQDEYEQVQKTTARFVAYLKDNAIILNNDTTKAYYDELIKHEENNIEKGKEMKMDVQGNEAKLKSLKRGRSEYLELVDTIRNNVHTSHESKKQLHTQDDIYDEINELFKLKHFGRSFRNLEDVMISSKNVALRRQPRRRLRKSSLKTESRSVRFEEDVRDRHGPTDNTQKEASGGRRSLGKGLGDWFSNMSMQ